MIRFEMAEDKTHARVYVNEIETGKIMNTPEYLGGGLNYTGQLVDPLYDETMWDEFFIWAEKNMPVDMV